MGCRERQIELQQHLAGELAPARAAALEQHLSGCAACRTDLDGYRRLAHALESLPEPEVPATLHAELMAALRPHFGYVRMERETLLHRRVRRAVTWVLVSAFALSFGLALGQWVERVVRFSTHRFTQDLDASGRYLQDLWYIVTRLGAVIATLRPTFASLLEFWQRSTGPVEVWGPLGVAFYLAVLGLGGWLCWRAYHASEERRIHHAA